MNPRPVITPAILALACAWLAPGCVTTTATQPPGIDDREIARAVPVRSWLAQGPAGPALGCVVRLEAPDDPGRFLYVVRNLYSQDLGLVDSLGRAYRHRPHQDQPEVLGAGTVAEGAARILESGTPVELIEIALADLPIRLEQELRRHSAERRPAAGGGL